MAKIKLNPVLQSLAGKIADMRFFRRGSRIMAGAATRDKGPGPDTPARSAHRLRFIDAASYAKSALQDPDAGAFYRALAKDRESSPFAVAVGDRFKAPTVLQINLDAYHGVVGDRIAARAYDDVEVTAVTISITHEDGSVVETGPAVLTDGLWAYVATVELPIGTPVVIEAEATDRAKNKGRLTQPFQR